MICSLMLDRDDSADFPGNKGAALGRPLASYPLMAARSSPHIRRHYVVTDSPPVKAVALQYGAVIVDYPAGVHAPAPFEALLAHGYRSIAEEVKKESEAVELLVVLLSNAPAVTVEAIDKGIEALLARPELDSAVSVSSYNRFQPLSARRESPEGLIEPYVPFDPKASGEVWYPDGGVQVLRPRCVEAGGGPPPAPWTGRKVLPIKQWGGGPIDYQSQISSLEYWLKKHGAIDQTPRFEMQPKPQPQAAPKGDRR